MFYFFRLVLIFSLLSLTENRASKEVSCGQRESRGQGGFCRTQNQAEQVHGDAQLRGASGCHGWQRGHRHPWGCGDSSWLSQGMVQQAPSHAPDDSLELHGKEAEARALQYLPSRLTSCSWSMKLLHA